MMQAYRVVKCKEHYNVVDEAGAFVCSADTVQEAYRDIGEMLGKEYNDTGGSGNSS